MSWSTVNSAGVQGSTSLLAKESGGNLAASKADLDTVVTQTANVAKETGGNVAGIKTDTAHLDANMSTLAKESGGNLAAAKTDLDTISTRTPALGQATKANSSPVVVASDQGNLSVTLATDSVGVAKESGGNLASINTKLQSQAAAIFPCDKSCTTTAAAINADSAYRQSIVLMADAANTDKIFLGNSGTQTFPLAAGAQVTLYGSNCSIIYAKSNTGTQTLHVICGGI